METPLGLLDNRCGVVLLLEVKSSARWSPRNLVHGVSCFTSFLYSDSSSLVMRPRTDVSSANFMMWFEVYFAEQSWVSSMNSIGLSTHPWGDPVLTVMVDDVLLPILTVCYLCVSPGSNCRCQCLRLAAAICPSTVVARSHWMLNWSRWAESWHRCS